MPEQRMAAPVTADKFAVGGLVEPREVRVRLTADTSEFVRNVRKARLAVRGLVLALGMPLPMHTSPALRAMHADYARRRKARRRR